jgi:hypothetical protein
MTFAFLAGACPDFNFGSADILLNDLYEAKHRGKKTPLANVSGKTELTA